MWIKVAASIGLVSIGIAIGLFANLVKLGGDSDQNATNMYQSY
ncbi:hypothetical protein ACFVT8_04920 [Lysinibacillus sp. NPDC058147]